jgi:hypothetical protein
MHGQLWDMNVMKKCFWSHIAYLAWCVGECLFNVVHVEHDKNLSTCKNHNETSKFGGDQECFELYTHVTILGYPIALITLTLIILFVKNVEIFK